MYRLTFCPVRSRCSPSLFRPVGDNTRTVMIQGAVFQRVSRVGYCGVCMTLPPLTVAFCLPHSHTNCMTVPLTVALPHPHTNCSAVVCLRTVACGVRVCGIADRLQVY